MSIQTSFFNWASSGLPYDEAPWESCSPNLQALLGYLRGRWGGYSLGCEQDRSVRQGTAISSHSFGSALDWRYTPVTAGSIDVPRHIAVGEILPWVIDYSTELHIDAIHDYAGDRIWRAGRTADIDDAHGAWWRKQNGAGSGMGESWATYFHFETNLDGWADATPIVDRIHVAPTPNPDPSPPPQPAPTGASSSLEFLSMMCIAKTTDGPNLASTGFGAGSLAVGDTPAHDITTEAVFAAGNGRALDVGSRPMSVVSWSPNSPGSWVAVKARLTKAQALALLGPEI